MESDSLGKRLVRSLIAKGEFDLPKYGLKASDFSFDAYEAVKFIEGFKDQFGKIPTEEQLLENVQLEFTKEVEDPSYVAGMILKRKAEFELDADLRKAAKLLRDLGPEDASAYVREIAAKDYFLSKQTEKLEYFVAGAEERKQRYFENKTKRIKGIPFPWETLNKACLGLMPGELSVFFATSSTGKCLDENTLVTSSDGLRKTIKEIVENRESVYSIDPETKEFRKVTPVDWFYSGEKECLEVSFGPKDILVGSKDHPVLTKTGWVKLNDLNQGDYVARTGFIPDPDILTKWDRDELVFVASLLADGCLTRREEITYTKKDDKLVSLMKETCDKLGLNLYQRPSQKNTYTWAISKARTVWGILNKYGIYPSKSNAKIMPPELYRLPKDAISVFLGVFWSHDGDIYNRGNDTVVSMSLSSKELVLGVRHLLLRLGIFSRYSEKITNFGTQAFRLYVPSLERNKFFERLLLVRNLPVVKTFFKGESSKFDSIYWDTVKATKPVGFRRTYDLSVEKTHSFEAAYTHVHNSWASCILASNALNEGYKTMLVTMEMPASKIAGRLDCVHYSIPYSDIKQNDIDVFNEQRWISQIEQEKEGEILILDNNQIQYVDDISRYAAEFKPDLIVVDGGYILKSHVRGTNWEQTADVVKAIQETCQKMKIPWMVTTQQNLPDKKTMTSQDKAGRVRYGREWWLVSDIMVELSQNEEQRDLLREVSFHIIKIREADGNDLKTEFKAHWDFNFSKFGEIPDGYCYDFDIEF